MNNTKAKPGRKPIGDGPLSSAERMKRARNKRRENGRVERLLSAPLDLFESLSAIAEERGISRNELIVRVLSAFAKGVKTRAKRGQ